MIGKLRRKFILINMLLVTAVLLIVLVVQYTASVRRLEQDSLSVLRRTLEKSDDAGPDKFPFGGKPDDAPGPSQQGAVFTAHLSADGTVEVSAAHLEVSQAAAEEAVRQAVDSGESSGVLTSLNVRFLTRQMADGLKIAFQDLSFEYSTLTGQLGTMLLVGLGGLLAFLGVSVFLAGWALRPVERAWRQQGQFVADASHELKTPLTVILANAGILLSHPEQTVAAQQKWIVNTRDESERMKRLVDDLLFLARADDAPPKAAFAPVDLSDTAWGCLLPFESMAFECGVKLDAHVAEGAAVLGDADQLRQLLVILLDNACKYAGAGGEAVLGVELEGDRVQLRVKNSGQPIPAADLPHVFERFYRADPARASDGRGGHGLGLAIAQRIVQTHGGRIKAESDPEAGTVFTVSLPRLKQSGP